MAKKNIKAAAETGANTLLTIAQGTQYTEDTPHTQGVQYTEDTPKEYWRLNLRLPVEFKEYIQAQAYRQSNEKHTVSATEYLCNLIREDMEKNGRK